ncbi:MAG TPA: iron ABC transporter permease [Planctomycetaceae bacterium]|nr:iron ABC transporter permease [Planctomycetaceae bacterium]
MLRHGWSAAGLVIAALISTPVIVVVASLFFDSGGVWQHLAETVLATYVVNTALLALGVVAGTLLLGTGAAWAVTLCRFPGRSFFTWALLLPLAIPTYLAAYSYTDLLQFSGPVQTWLRTTFGWQRGDYWFPEVRSLPGAIALFSLVLYPYVYLAARAAFLEQSVCVLEASRTLGLNPRRSFFRVALPLARPSLAAGASLVLMESVAEFGAVDYCAVDTFATGIYRTWMSRGSVTAAAQLAACLLGFVAVAIALEQFSRRSARHYHPTYRYRVLPGWPLRGWRAAAVMAGCGMPVVFGFVVPAAVFVWMTWRGGDPRARELFWELGKNTFLLAAISSLLAVALALVIAYGKRLWPARVMRAAAGIAVLGYAIPGGVIAVGILIPAIWLDHRLADVRDRLFGGTSGLVITGTVGALILGYQVRFMAVSLNVINAGLTRIRTTLDDAARTLGASRSRMLARVHAPLLRTSLLSAALLVFVDVIKELPATLLLRPFDFDTLAVRVHQLASDERLPEASTGGLAIILVGLIPVYLLSRAINRSRPGAAVQEEIRI